MFGTKKAPFCFYLLYVILFLLLAVFALAFAVAYFYTLIVTTAAILPLTVAFFTCLVTVRVTRFLTSTAEVFWIQSQLLGFVLVGTVFDVGKNLYLTYIAYIRDVEKRGLFVT